MSVKNKFCSFRGDGRLLKMSSLPFAGAVELPPEVWQTISKKHKYINSVVSLLTVAERNALKASKVAALEAVILSRWNASGKTAADRSRAAEALMRINGIGLGDILYRPAAIKTILDGKLGA